MLLLIWASHYAAKLLNGVDYPAPNRLPIAVASLMHLHRSASRETKRLTAVLIHDKPS
jgi:hypothetical protein